LIWHFYHVIFDPEVYPLNTACLDGRISEELQAHWHPPENQQRFALIAANQIHSSDYQKYREQSVQSECQKTASMFLPVILKFWQVVDPAET
jgi:hypothetical protein